MTNCSASPLIRANFTYSLSSTSSIAERVRRMNPAMVNTAIENAGMTKYRGSRPSFPKVGKRPNSTAKIHIRMIASQNWGIDIPRMANPLPNRSKKLSRLTADKIPNGMPTAMAMIRADDRQLYRVGNSLYDHVKSRLALVVRAPEIADEQATQVVEVPYHDGPIQTEVFADLPRFPTASHHRAPWQARRHRSDRCRRIPPR